MDGAYSFVVAILVVGAVCMVVTVWALIDAAQRSDEEFAAAGQQRTLWLVLLAVGAITQFGIVLAIAYMVAVPPRVVAAGTGKT